ncbi:UNVERIFIED_CONTAM: hypothetical protein FKN15_062959 [Acipenser sinensis]
MKASSTSLVAGLLAVLGAPEPLLHDLSQDPRLDNPDAQASRSLACGDGERRVKCSKQTRDIMDLKAQMTQVLELLAKQAPAAPAAVSTLLQPQLPYPPSPRRDHGGWDEASQLVQEDMLSIAAFGDGASFSSDMQQESGQQNNTNKPSANLHSPPPQYSRNQDSKTIPTSPLQTSTHPSTVQQESGQQNNINKPSANLHSPPPLYSRNQDSRTIPTSPLQTSTHPLHSTAGIRTAEQYQQALCKPPLTPSTVQQESGQQNNTNKPSANLHSPPPQYSRNQDSKTIPTSHLQTSTHPSTVQQESGQQNNTNKPSANLHSPPPQYSRNQDSRTIPTSPLQTSTHPLHSTAGIRTAEQYQQALCKPPLTPSTVQQESGQQNNTNNP